MGLGRDGELEPVSIVFNFSLVRYFTPRSLLARPHWSRAWLALIDCASVFFAIIRHYEHNFHLFSEKKSAAVIYWSCNQVFGPEISVTSKIIFFCGLRIVTFMGLWSQRKLPRALSTELRMRISSSVTWLLRVWVFIVFRQWIMHSSSF